MDRGAREVKRGGTKNSLAKQRQHKASGHKLLSALNGGDVEVSERSKKDKVRCSSNEDGEMMGGGSEGEEEFGFPSNSSRKRFKLNGKAFDDCNAVDPATVPRRLRSAMNKRNHESVSPPLPDPKRNNRTFVETDLPHVNGVRRSKLHMKLGGSDKTLKHGVPNTITKDEEEVAEALFALASTIDDTDKDKVDRITEEAEVPSPLPKNNASSLPPLEALKGANSKSLNDLAAAEASNLNLCEGESSVKTENVWPVMGPTVLEQPTTSGSQKFKLELNDASQVGDQDIGLSSKDERAGPTQLNDAVNSGTPTEVQSESYPGNGLLETIHPKSLPMRRPESDTLPAVAVATQQNSVKEVAEGCTHPKVSEGAANLLHTMPNGLSDGLLHLTKTSATKAGGWPDSATDASRPGSAKNDVSREKPVLVSVGRRQSFKRCAYHVYISRLIRSYQSVEKKSWPPSANQSKLNEGKMSGTTAFNDPRVLKTDINNVTSVSAHGVVAGRNLHEARPGTLQNNKPLQDQRASTSYGIYPQQKQSCDFLSLSAGGESARNTGNGFESSAQLHVPYLHPLVQHPMVPFSLPNVRYPSPYPDQLAAASQQVELQLPQYSSNAFYGTQLAHGSLAKQQQQQQLWAARMAHYRPCNSSSAQLPKWQNGRHDAPPLIPCTQSSVPPSPSSLDVLGPRYMPSPQQLFAVSSSRGKRQHHHNYPNSYDESGAPQLQQLLCNAQNM
eukprot:TRINITY_DN9004_c0_g1_i5.p1 TRINITY_DN9004_c0_g1~~TRINITY_DN9004_c0_g1_i5.p1  ORF type:complete len:728 (-),score=198.73 TRINITY_DN9004_c0_g1_i5:359-2542(-)